MRRPSLLALLGLAAVAIAVAALVAFAIPRSKSAAENELQGDVDCNALVDSVDALHTLRSVAELPQTADCLDAADVDCDDDKDAVDALRTLRYIVQLANPVVAGCAPIGGPLAGTPTPTTTPSGGTPTATPTPTPTATAPPGGYQLAASGITTAWGDILDFALIPGSPGEAVVIRQGGELWRVFLGGSPPPPALYGDLNVPVKSSGNEQGLLSLAFSPDFQNDGQLYVYYTAQTCTAGTRCHHLSRVTVTAADIDESSEVVVLEYRPTRRKQPQRRRDPVRERTGSLSVRRRRRGRGRPSRDRAGQHGPARLSPAVGCRPSGHLQHPARQPLCGRRRPGQRPSLGVRTAEPLAHER